MRCQRILSSAYLGPFAPGGEVAHGGYPQVGGVYFFADTHLRVMGRHSTASAAVKSIVAQAHPRALRAWTADLCAWHGTHAACKLDGTSCPPRCFAMTWST